MERFRRAPWLIGSLAYMLLAWCPNVRALNPSLDVSQYAHTASTVHQGFVKGTTWALAQTPDGYLWLGTEFGLLRFDGVKTVPWQPRSNERLPSSIVECLLVARDGTLWIGTNGGLASLKNGKLTRYPELDGQTVSSAIEDRQGTIWTGSWHSPSGRLCEIQGGKATCYGEDGSLGIGIYSLYEDSRGNLWAGQTTGVWRWRPGSPKFYALPKQARGNPVTSLIEGDNNALLIITPGGFFQLADGKTEPYSPPGNAVHFSPDRSLRDRDGGLWIGTMGHGLVHVHQGKADVFRQSDGLSGDFIGALFEDREGNIWIGTDGGVDRFSGLIVSTVSSKQGLSNAAVWSVLAAKDGSVWLGTPEGVNRWKEGQITAYRKRKASGAAQLEAPARVSDKTDSGLPDDGVDSLYQDEKGLIWVSTLRGMAKFENGRFLPVPGLPDGVVYSIAGDRAGNLWVAFSQYGLFHLFGGTVIERIPWENLTHNGYALALLPDPIRGGVWLGFGGGGLAYFENGQVRARYTDADGLGHGIIRNLQLDKDGTLWAATEGGLSRIRNGRIATLTSHNGLPCDTVFWKAEDDAASVWLRMDCGLVRIAQTELSAWVSEPKRKIQTAVFESSDGVPIEALTSAFSSPVTKSVDGKLWFADRDGAVVIDPRHIPFNGLAPPVHVEQMVADGRTYDPTANTNGQISLASHTRDVRIDYTALSFVAPEKVRFRYRLEGQDPDWKEVVNLRQVRYTNLAPGHYTFRVIACNNDGVWNETGASLHFSIAPAYYQTVWFRICCVALLLLLLRVAYLLRVRQLEAEFAAGLEARVDERTRIARDLHDTLLQTFNALLPYLQTVSNVLPSQPDEAKRRVDRAIEQATNAITDGRDAVHALRSGGSAATDLDLAISNLAKELLSSTASETVPEIHVQVEGKPTLLNPIVRDEAYRIATEAVRNAIRHANARRIEVEIRFDEQHLRLRIGDNGTGIDPAILNRDHKAGHWGLRGMRERAKLVGGTLEVWSQPNVGTEIELSIPAAMVYSMPSSARSSLLSRFRRS